jgi:hypothetical protein
LITKSQPEAQDKDPSNKKIDDKKENADIKPLNPNSGTNNNINIIENERSERKEEISHISSDIMEQSDDDRGKKDKVKGKKEFSEQELDTKIYITLNETQTTFMYFAPSQKYFTNKNGKFCFKILRKNFCF